MKTTREELELARIAYTAGNLEALRDALNLCDKYNVPLPFWLYVACKQLIFEKMGYKEQPPQMVEKFPHNTKSG